MTSPPQLADDNAGVTSENTIASAAPQRAGQQAFAIAGSPDPQKRGRGEPNA
jgi:hypothetical protein